MVITFDLIGGRYGGGITAGALLMEMLDGSDRLAPAIPAQPKPTGLPYDQCNYATLLPMKVGLARETRPVDFLTHKYSAYWLPWSHLGVDELQLTDENVNFFFTAMFSGCTFAVATPAGVDGAKRVYVTHIAGDPGPNIPAIWGGPAPAAAAPAAPPATAAVAQTRRLACEVAFYTHRLGANRPIRSVTSSNAPLVGGALGFPGAGLGTTPLANTREQRQVAVHRRIDYSATGAAFIAGWRGRDKKWRFAVQQQPSGVGGAVLAGNVNVIAAHQFY